jgi:acyl-coenzyme A thioesterase PaaI-like protein
VAHAQLDAALHQVPFIAHMGVRVEDAKPGSVVLRLPFNDDNCASDNTLYSAAVFAVAELAALVVVGTHPRLHKFRTELLTSSVRYQGRSMSDVTAHAELTPEQVQRIVEEIHHGGKGEAEVTVPVLNGHGDDIAVVSVWIRATPA